LPATQRWRCGEAAGQEGHTRRADPDRGRRPPHAGARAWPAQPGPAAAAVHRRVALSTCLAPASLVGPSDANLLGRLRLVTPSSLSDVLPSGVCLGAELSVVEAVSRCRRGRKWLETALNGTRNLCACSADLNRWSIRSRLRVGRC